MPRPATFDHLRKRQPIEAAVQVYLEEAPLLALGEARENLSEAQEALGRAEAREASLRGTEGHGEAQERLRALQARVDEAQEVVDRAQGAVEEITVEVRYRSIGRKAYDRLVDDHPATEEQKAQAKEAGYPPPPYNSETFPPALIAASAVEPRMSLDEVQALFDEWNTAELTEHFGVALQVNTARRTADLGKG